MTRSTSPTYPLSSEMQEFKRMTSRRRLFPKGGGDDVAPHVDNSTNGPMTRSRVKALHEKVTSLLSMCDFDIPLNGLLLHAGTLCILRIHLDDDIQWSREDGQGEDEEGGGASLAGLQPGLGQLPGRPQARDRRPPGRPPARPRPAPRPAF